MDRVPDIPNTVMWGKTTNTVIWTVDFDKEKHPTCIQSWLVYAPWMHPLWHYHAASLVHLRPHEGSSEPRLLSPEITHEFMAAALYPDVNLEEVGACGMVFMTPLDILQQFVAGSDTLAMGKVEEGLSMVLQGQLSLDQDLRSAWRNLLIGGQTIGAPVWQC